MGKRFLIPKNVAEECCRSTNSMALLMLEVLKGPLAFLLESMTRILLRSRRLMAVSILLLLAGVVVLSAATRKPCLRVCTAPWHLWKAGHMTKPEGQEACKLRVTAEAQTPQTAPEESLASAPIDLSSRDEESIPPANLHSRSNPPLPLSTHPRLTPSSFQFSRARPGLYCCRRMLLLIFGGRVRTYRPRDMHHAE